jgi:hypothetical protein
VDDRLQLRGAKSDKNAKNARFDGGRGAKSDKNAKNARFGDAPEAKSDKNGKNARFWEGRSQKTGHGDDYSQIMRKFGVWNTCQKRDTTKLRQS